ncbi:hypothetical protein ACOSP7_011947 [Xanthoceras sorbifolium]
MCFSSVRRLRKNVAINGGRVREASALYCWAEDFISSSPLFSRQSSAWCPPPVGFLKLNLDVAIRVDSGFIGVGAIIRDSAGDIVVAVSKLLSGFFSAEMGEFLALREGLILAKSLGLSIFEAEVDASNVASAVNLSSNCCGDASFIVDDIKALCLEVGNCRCLAIPRSGNRLAYVLASMAFSSGVDQSWPSVAKDCFFAV